MPNNLVARIIIGAMITICAIGSCVALLVGVRLLEITAPGIAWDSLLKGALLILLFVVTFASTKRAAGVGSLKKTLLPRVIVSTGITTLIAVLISVFWLGVEGLSWIFPLAPWNEIAIMLLIGAMFLLCMPDKKTKKSAEEN